MSKKEFVEKIIATRSPFLSEERLLLSKDEDAAEGGCGVIGLASSEQVAARHLLQALYQMRNRGNGKGGGIAAVGLVPEELGVSREVLENDYLLVVAYLEPGARERVEQEFIYSVFDVDNIREQGHIEDHNSIEGLDVRPPDVVMYFVRIKSHALKAFIEEHNLGDFPIRLIEDEFIYQNSYKLNVARYASLGEKEAFVLSHGKNMLVLKMVGYGDDVIRYYGIDNMHAHVWIGHHRYPTKGRVWHPGGAHPFVGMHEALVHNGDFANYASIVEYLKQRNIYPLFLTDTEVSVQVFDLLHRTYGYPLEYVIEALAPTTELDFALLPKNKKRIYKMLQTTHMHSSPDGPWFFLIAQSDVSKEENQIYRLIGITDTSMLRPQVFAWQSGHEKDGKQVAIGLAASEKQGIDAALSSLASEDECFWPRADLYWNARGGSHTDGGAFVFSVEADARGRRFLTCANKFGEMVHAPTNTEAFQLNGAKQHNIALLDMHSDDLFSWITARMPTWGYQQVLGMLKSLEELAKDDPQKVIDTLTCLVDRHYPVGDMRRSSLLALYDASLDKVFMGLRNLKRYLYHGFGRSLPSPDFPEQILLLNAGEYDPEGENSLATELVTLYKNGFKRFIVTGARGHRFIGNGFGSEVYGVRIDVYGSPGDYLASGADGLEIYVHGSAQDQIAQIMKSGRLVVYGDVGQTFMYGAKGGEAYVLGNAAGRPLINAVGKPRVVINGTCLDYLAESFMAGDPVNGGGFAILNGIAYSEDNQIIELEAPYPGGNLFSLASGGAIYLRDPYRKVVEAQLNGGEFTLLDDHDWDLIVPYLRTNEELFGIPVTRLLEVDGKVYPPEKVYRKIRPRSLRALQAEEAWVTRPMP
jgi:glutamate synthase domain-containing protein 1/glutamate synthase domain-containing protein 3